MKKLKFYANLAKLILNGEKTITWRFFDDKELTVGDIVICIVAQTNEEFAKIKIISVKETIFEEINLEDYKGHEKFSSKKEMYNTYSKYYNNKISSKTPLKIIKFKVI